MTAARFAPMDHDEAEDLAPSFVLGALERTVSGALRAHLATCGRPHPEIDELGGVAGYLAEVAEPIEPAHALRARILAAVEAEASGAVPRQPDRGRRRGFGLGRSWLSGWRPAATLATLALVVVLAASTLQLAGRLGDAQAYADQTSQAAALAASPGSRSAPMTPAVPGGPSGVAVLVPSGAGRVVLSGLAAIQGAEVYEVWLIGGAGRPVPAGELHTTGAGTGWLDTLAPVATGPLTVAVTREPGPGATTPTLPVLTSGAPS